MTDDSIVSERLYFAYTLAPPPLDRFDVKRTVSAELFGKPATLTIIGSSHYIASRQLGFHELCSCRPLHAESMASVSLLEPVDQSFTFENDLLSASTTLETRPLSDHPTTDHADIAYRFASEAWTMITLTRTGYETYHTYPEYDCTLYTRTHLTAVTDIESSDIDPPLTTDCRIQTD
ncbi:DUF2617 family protein [Halocatena salina]|uniref:DUF2617 family protein n=1 Tax=Halocatena salina TaxID=2934340 RepID=A0A8U0A513_9EURY|nr:DUF2617 family protein [Halocatena salina]UPM43043.1 DUF2617 family protein [Halocatena salina]